MREQFEKMVAAGKLSHKHLEALVVLAENGFCWHRSWGFGRIKTIDPVFGRFTIDFAGRLDHVMDLGFAADSLKPISKDHILARKVADLHGLKEMAARNHLDLIKLVVLSYGGKASLDQIQKLLVPDVIGEDWKKWWEQARHELKKDGHFVVPLKKIDPILYQAQTVQLRDRLLKTLRDAKGLKARAAAASDILRSLPDLDEKPAVIEETVRLLDSEIPTHQRTQPSVALDAIFVRDDLRADVNLPLSEGASVEKDVWSHRPDLGEMLAAMPQTRHRRVLVSFKTANPDNWHESVLITMNRSMAKVVGECASMLMSEGRWDALKANLARLISQHGASTELLLWLAKERSDSYADILGPEVFRAMLTAMERDQFNEVRANRLGDYVMSDQSLLVELIGSADLEVIKDLTRTLQFSPSFDDMDKRSLLARIVKTYPAIQSLITGEQPKQDTKLIVSWTSLERRRLEYDDLVHKRIPANSKEIAVARSYGDLRENHEYKAAKEMQKVLMRRKGELESELGRSQGTDFANARTDVVGIGTRVQVTDLETGQPEVFTVLGAWDSDPDKGIISYLTAMAQTLLSHKPGDEVVFDNKEHGRRLRIDSIEAVNASAVPGLAPGAPAASETSAQPPVAEVSPEGGTPPAPEVSAPTVA